MQKLRLPSHPGVSWQVLGRGDFLPNWPAPACACSWKIGIWGVSVSQSDQRRLPCGQAPPVDLTFSHGIELWQDFRGFVSLIDVFLFLILKVVTHGCHIPGHQEISSLPSSWVSDQCRFHQYVLLWFFVDLKIMLILALLWLSHWVLSIGTKGWWVVRLVGWFLAPSRLDSVAVSGKHQTVIGECLCKQNFVEKYEYGELPVSIDSWLGVCSLFCLLLLENTH